MANKLFENTRKPTKTIGGRLMLSLMNTGHNLVAKWGFNHLELSESKNLLDIGCGGGKNIKNLLKLSPDAVVYGIDYSSASVEHSIKLNKKSISSKKVYVKEASVELIPYEDSKFDCVTAFETIYFWPNIEKSFVEVIRVLKKGGTFMVCNEAQQPEGSEHWIEMLHMKIYTGKEIQILMESAGLSEVKIDEHKNGKWLCVTGKK